MIVYKRWYHAYGGRIREVCDGWYLFGWLPLYIRKVEVQS